MLAFLLKRLGVMVLTALCLTLIVFALVNLKPNLVKLAKEQTGSRITEQQVEVWLDQNGFNRPFLVRYGEWLGDVVRGDLGHSTRFNAPVADVLWPRLWLTAKLMFWVMVVMVPGALLLGVLAGMREGSAQDRVLSTDRHRHHLDAGVRLGRGADGDLREPDGRPAMVLRLRHLGRRRRHHPLQLRPAGADHRHLRHGLHRPDDPRLDGRGDDPAVHPHRPAEGRELPRASCCSTRSGTR